MHQVQEPNIFSAFFNASWEIQFLKTTDCYKKILPKLLNLGIKGSNLSGYATELNPDRFNL